MKHFRSPYISKINLFDRDISLLYAIALSDAIYKKHGYKEKINNKQKMLSIFTDPIPNMDNLCLDIDSAKEMADWYLEYLSFKVITNEITDFEKSIIKTLKKDNINKYSSSDVAIVSAIPMSYHMAKQREKFDDLLDEVRNISNFFGEIKKRYNLNLKLVSKKHIKSKDLWVINCIDDDSNMFFYFDKEDNKYNINDYMKIRATVNKHEFSKFSQCKETRLSRVSYVDK